jgi:hypothetical protein
MDVRFQVTTVVGETRKEIDFSLDRADEVQKWALICGMFEVLGVNVPEVFTTYERIGKAYKDFFDQVRPEEPKVITVEASAVTNVPIMTSPPVKHMHHSISQHDIDALKYAMQGGEVTYKCRVFCDCVSYSQVTYIAQHTKSVNCPSCGKKLRVYQTMDKFLEPDKFGNYFRAKPAITD